MVPAWTKIASRIQKMTKGPVDGFDPNNQDHVWLAENFGYDPYEEKKTYKSLSFKQPEVEQEFEGVKDYLKQIASNSPSPITITSGRRTPETNIAVGGADNSYHLSGDSLDIRKSEKDKDIIDYFNKNGLDVLDEADHLHVQPSKNFNKNKAGNFDPNNPDHIWLADNFGYKYDKPEPPIDPMKGTNVPTFGQAIKEGLKRTSDQLYNLPQNINEKIGLSGPGAYKKGQFLNNVSKDIVNLGVGLPAGIIGSVIDPRMYESFIEKPVETGKNLLGETVKTIAAPFDPRMYSADKIYESPLGSALNLAQAIGLGSSIVKNIKSPVKTAPVEGNLAGEKITPMDPESPIPESPITLNKQVESMSKGNAPAVLVTPGAEMPAIPNGMQVLDSEVGTWIYDPKKLDAEVIQDMVADGTHGELLGHLEPKSDATTVAVQAKEGPVELKTSAVSPENVEAQAQVLQEQFPGSEIEAKPIGEKMPELIEQRKIQETSEEVQKQIEDKVDQLMSQGLSWKEAEFHPDVEALYNKRDHIDRQDLINAKQDLEYRIRQAVPDINPDYITKYILKMDPDSTAGFTIPFEHAPKLANDKPVLGAKILDYLVEDYGKKNNLDMQGVLNSDISGLTKKGIRDLKVELVKKSKDIADAIEGYFKPNSVKDMSNFDLLKLALSDETGAIGKDIKSVKSEKAQASKQARDEIVSRVTNLAKESGLALDQVLAKLEIDPAVYAKVQARAQEDQSRFSSSGLDTGKGVQGRLSYNPEKFNAPEDVQNLFKDTAAKEGEFTKQRISKSDADIRELADLVDVSVDDLIEAKPGSIANAETVYKARGLVMGLAQDLRDATKAIDMATATPEQLQIIKEKYLRLVGAMKSVAGFRSEASHVFRQFKQKISPMEEGIMQDLTGMLKKIDVGSEDLTQFIKQSKKLIEPGFGDKLWHLWYSSILSGPATHLKNIIGSVSELTGEAGRVALTNPKELPASISGLFKGLVEGAKRGKEILKEGETSKFEQRGLLPIKFKGMASPLNLADYVGRLLSATDAVFEGGGKGFEAGGVSKSQGIPFEEAMQSPDVAKFGEKLTYKQKPAGVLGVLSDAIGQITRKIPAARLIVPFSKVVANVLNNSLDFTPAGFLRSEFKGAREKFGIETQRQINQQRGRAALGTLGMTWLASLASQGMLNGDGPNDYNKRQQIESTGVKFNSIKIGDTYYPLALFGKFQLPMALVANYFDDTKYNQGKEVYALDRFSQALTGSASTVLNMSFLSGLSDLMDAVKNSDTKGKTFLKKFISQQAGSVVPSLVKQISRSIDSGVYDTESLGEKIKNTVRATGGLKPKLDVWGDPIKGDRVSGLSPKKDKNDPVKKYLVSRGIYISYPSKATTIIGSDGKKRFMTRDELYNYVQQSGPMIYDVLKDNLETIKAIDDVEQQKNLVQNLVQSARNRVKSQIQEGALK